jgi:hypothetical protein
VVSKFRWLAAAAAATVITAAAVISGGGAAQATTPPAWRISAVYGEDSGVGGIAAASANNAWATENCTKPCHTGSDGYTLRHWNGRQWQVVTAKPAHELGGIQLLEIAPGATSKPWAVYPYKTFEQTAVAHWTGTSWAAPTVFAKDFFLTAAVAPGSSAVWAFGRNETVGRAGAGARRGQRERRVPERHLGDRLADRGGQGRLADGGQPLERDEVDHHHAAPHPGAGRQQRAAAVDRGEWRG